MDSAGLESPDRARREAIRSITDKIAAKRVLADDLEARLRQAKSLLETQTAHVHQLTVMAEENQQEIKALAKEHHRIMHEAREVLF